MSRPLVSVYSGRNGKVVGQIKFAGVMQAPVRPDVVHHVHRDISKNHRQPYAVMKGAGHQTSAESWGTGRAVARIPRVPGGGTHRAGQGAFGNMCRGGHMFAPTKTYRRWHRKVNKNQRRYAIVSSLAASGSVPLVLARGHRIERVPEIPLVISNETIVNLQKTKAAVRFLKVVRAYTDVEKVATSKKIRAGKGKSRNRRHTQKRGPLVIYLEKTSLCRAFRNLPGVDLCCVTRLNLLQLAPGGHVGRFVIWTKAAYEKLEILYGSYSRKSTMKIGYTLPRAVVTTSNLARLLKAPEVVSLLRRKKRNVKYPKHRKNPLTNLLVMLKFNPYAKTTRRKELLASHPRVKALVAAHDQRKQDRKKKVEEARAKSGFTPKPSTYQKPKLSYRKKQVSGYLKRKGLGKKKSHPKDAKAAQPTEGSESSETTQSAEGTDTKTKRVARKSTQKRVGRKPRFGTKLISTPGKPLRRGNRYHPLALKNFRDQRARRLLRQERMAARSIIPTPKAGEIPFVEYEKKKRPKLTPKDIRARITQLQKRHAELNKKRKEKAGQKEKVERKKKGEKSDDSEKPKRTKKTPPPPGPNHHPRSAAVKAFARLMHS